MTRRRRRRGTTRYIGDMIDNTLDRASDVEHDLRRAARTAVEERDDDWDGDGRDDWDRDDGDWDDGDWGDCSDDEIDDIVDDLVDAVRELRRCGGPRRRRRHTRGRTRSRSGGRSRDDSRDLAGHVTSLNRRVEELSRQVRTLRSDGETE